MISMERGSTKLGTGVINYYIYVNKENVNSEVYTEIYMKCSSNLKKHKKYKEFKYDNRN